MVSFHKNDFFNKAELGISLKEKENNIKEMERNMYEELKGYEIFEADILGRIELQLKKLATRVFRLNSNFNFCGKD